MGFEPQERRKLKSLTTDELRQLWVDACKNWAANPGREEPNIAAVEGELDFRNEGLPFHLVRDELASLARSLPRGHPKRAEVWPPSAGTDKKLYKLMIMSLAHRFIWV